LVVQLVRMPPCHGGGRGFESRPVRKKARSFEWAFAFFEVVQATWTPFREFEAKLNPASKRLSKTLSLFCFQNLTL
jgi:hypothetical protein